MVTMRRATPVGRGESCSACLQLPLFRDEYSQALHLFKLITVRRESGCCLRVGSLMRDRSQFQSFGVTKRGRLQDCYKLMAPILFPMQMIQTRLRLAGFSTAQ